MPEPFTILTAVSSAPAVLKFAHDSVELYSKLRDLRSETPPRPLSKSDGLTKFEKRQVEEIYAALEAARPIASELAERALRYYIFMAGIAVALLVVASIVVLTIPFRPWLIVITAAIFVLGPLGIMQIIPRSLTDALAALDSKTAAEVEGLVKEIKAEVSNFHIGLAITVRSSGISLLERGFLNAYCKAEALTRVLECDLLSRNLARSVSQLYETFTGRIFDRSVDIIVTLANDGQLSLGKNNREILREAFDKEGLLSMVSDDYVPPGFFGTDFANLASDRKRLEEFCRGVWSSESRRIG